jgi:hypothetical protein
MIALLRLERSERLKPVNPNFDKFWHWADVNKLSYNDKSVNDSIKTDSSAALAKVKKMRQLYKSRDIHVEGSNESCSTSPRDTKSFQIDEHSKSNYSRPSSPKIDRKELTKDDLKMISKYFNSEEIEDLIDVCKVNVEVSMTKTDSGIVGNIDMKRFCAIDEDNDLNDHYYDERQCLRNVDEVKDDVGTKLYNENCDDQVGSEVDTSVGKDYEKVLTATLNSLKCMIMDKEDTELDDMNSPGGYESLLRWSLCLDSSNI